MAMGPGKYDDICTLVRDKTKAEGVIVVILKGEKGTGFSCQLNFDDTVAMPIILRGMADQIEKDINDGVV